jgi:Fur family transcriptional regulator, ferric uptake regulator
MEIPQQLRDSGLKATLPRLKILELFQHSDVRHLSAEDVYRLLLKGDLDVGLATIYRVLMQFVEAKILLRRQFEGGRAVFEINATGHHDHMVCVECSKVEEFFDLAIEERQTLLAKKRGFNLRDHSLSLYGLCKDCAARNHAQLNGNASRLQLPPLAPARIMSKFPPKLPKYK